jgi:hypothetical protein
MSDDIPLGAVVDPASVADILREYRPVEGKDNDRKTIELPPPHQMKSRNVIVSWLITAGGY